ncbi:pirin family protein [Aeromicrobium sp. 179-A 4D2 NHS]|uniref:pirin family protein n=1 Tax=Aeromicrobium sp. 179-A 4D2 NHS TaxID=3142375 RepID=UPI00399F12DA
MPEPRRSAERYRTVGEGTETLHSFSYGRHYDAANVGFGPVVAINEERIAPGAGYDEHHHSDADIVTWVLEGVLAHEDSTGQRGLVRPGLAQRLSAGEGVTHAERNGSDTEPLRFVQMMLRSTNWGAPEYAQVEVPDGPGLHETVPVHAGARLLVARPAEPIVVDAPHGVLLHVTRGTVTVAGSRLGPGDELRIADPARLVLTGDRDAETLVWLVVGPRG